MTKRNLDGLRTPESNIILADKVKKEPARVLSAELTRYFGAVLKNLDHLEYGDPSEYLLRRTAKVMERSELSAVWVPPIFHRQDENSAEVTIDVVLKDPSRCVLVLAHPGSGKSTLARFLTCTYANRYKDSQSDFFALYVPLSGLKVSGVTYHRAVVQCAADSVGLGSDEQLIQELEKNFANMLLIFDGLDELPIVRVKDTVTTRSEAAELIRFFKSVSVQIRSIVTCRVYDYHEDPDSILAGVPHYFLSNFGPREVNDAIEKWHNAALFLAKKYASSNPALASDLRDRVPALSAALRDNSDLAGVCLTPLMLSILLTVYSDAGDLPSSVSQLCARAISWLMIEKHAGREPEPFIAQHSEWLLEAIAELGWCIHERSVAGKPKFADDKDIRDVARSTCPLKVASYEYEQRENAITKLAGHLRRGHGIFIKLNFAEERYDFAHNVFREVMAGRALDRRPVPDRRAFALIESWHAPIRYWAGLKAGTAQGRNDISAFVGELEADVDTGSTIAATLARGEMLVEVCAINDRSGFTRDLNKRITEVRKELKNLQCHADLSFIRRLRVGDLLSVLGDPILDSVAMARLCWIDGGPVTIGRIQNHATKIPKYGGCPAAPMLSGRLERFGIAAYLVTNLEFQHFIANHGYGRSEFWPSEIGWKWAQGDEQTLLDLVDRARQVAPTHLSSEIVGQRLVIEDIPDRCERMIRRKVPMYWSDPAMNRSNQPVVGVNWWEAIAYCRWLGADMLSRGLIDKNQEVRLPIEAEWETAARRCGDGGTYPWTEGSALENAHIRGREIGNSVTVARSCAVGSFPFVNSRLPIYDLIGNVWEWTATPIGAYSSESFQSKVSFDGLNDRIARGSSWLSSEVESSEITFRSFDPPYNAYEDLGFRIVVGPKAS